MPCVTEGRITLKYRSRSDFLLRKEPFFNKLNFLTKLFLNALSFPFVHNVNWVATILEFNRMGINGVEEKNESLLSNV